MSAQEQQPLGSGFGAGSDADDVMDGVVLAGKVALIAGLYPLLAAQGSRVVTYSSSAHHASDIRRDDPHFLHGYDKWRAYGQSKTATGLLAIGLDSRGQGDGVRAFTVHLGKILTGLQRDIPHAEQVDMGWVDEQGLFLEDCDIAPVHESDGAMTGGVEPYAVDPDSAERLWKLTVAVTATDLPR